MERKLLLSQRLPLTCLNLSTFNQIKLGTHHDGEAAVHRVCQKRDEDLIELIQALPVG